MPDRPNILFITSDQHHPDALGSVTPLLQTPHLDKLAKEGVRFTRAYCTNPTCTPCRASMITGKYPSQHGAWSLGTKLPESEHTLGEDFNAHGYRTALVGKAHFQQLKSTDAYPSLESYPIMQDLDFWRKFHGPFYGFEHVELARNHVYEAHAGQHYAIWMEEQGCKNWRDYFVAPTGTLDKGTRHHWPIPEEFHYDTWIADRTMALMDDYQAKGSPFFLWASFFDPHPPYMVPAPWDTMYDPADVPLPTKTEGEYDKLGEPYRMTQDANADWSAYRESGQGIHGCGPHLHGEQGLRRNIATYYGMISLMDKHIGRILDHLEARGLRDNTLVVFTADHSHLHGHHGLIQKGPFHFEDMLRVPMVVRMPGGQQGMVSESLQSIVDLAPTFLNACGIPVPNSMVGVDQAPVWKGEASTLRDHVIVENRHEPTTIHVKSYIEQRYKITVWYQRPWGELFDLEADPGETNNLWDSPEHQDLKRDMLLRFLWGEMGKEPLWMPRVIHA